MENMRGWTEAESFHASCRRGSTGGSGCAPTRLSHDRYGGDGVYRVSTEQRIQDGSAFVMKADGHWSLLVMVKNSG